MIDMRDMVKEFHVKMGQPNPGYMVKQPTQVALLRARLISEEFGEICEAIERGDMESLADGLGDLHYVVYGTAVAYGLELVSNDVVPLERLTIPPVHKLHRELLKMAQAVSGIVIRLHNLEANPSELQILPISLAVLVDATNRLAKLFQIPLGDIFREIHRSNMTKTPLNEHNKGGKGEGFSPADIRPILYKL